MGVQRPLKVKLIQNIFIRFLKTHWNVTGFLPVNFFYKIFLRIKNSKKENLTYPFKSDFLCLI